MINIQEAIEVAQTQLKNLFPTVSYVLLEEVEKSDDGDWLITLSFPDPQQAHMQAFISSNSARKYKLFVIGENGDFRKMKIRQL